MQSFVYPRSDGGDVRQRLMVKCVRQRQQKRLQSGVRHGGQAPRDLPQGKRKAAHGFDDPLGGRRLRIDPCVLEQSAKQRHAFVGVHRMQHRGPCRRKVAIRAARDDRRSSRGVLEQRVHGRGRRHVVEHHEHPALTTPGAKGQRGIPVIGGGTARVCQDFGDLLSVQMRCSGRPGEVELAVRERVAHGMRDVDRSGSLADTGHPGDGNDRRASRTRRLPELRHRLTNYIVAANEVGDVRWQQRRMVVRARPGSIRSTGGDIGAHHLPMQVLDIGPRLDTELVDQTPAQGPICLERFGTTTAPPQRSHELQHESLVEWMVRHRDPQFTDHLGLPAQREISLHP